MLDLFILIVIAWSIFSGWRNGLIREILSTGGLLVGLLGASMVYTYFGQFLAVATGSKVSVALNIVAFFLLWIIIPLVLGFVATLLTKFVRKLHLGLPNAVGGAAVAFVKYGILLSCLLSAMHSLGLLNEERAEKSVLYAPVSHFLGSVLASEISHNAQSNDSLQQSQKERPDTVWIKR